MSASDPEGVGVNAAVGQPELAEALRGLREEIRALRGSWAGGQHPDREHLQRQVRELLESLDELQLENEHLRSENERLLASQEQIAAALRGEEAPLPDHPPGPPSPFFDALRELPRLRESLSSARAEAAEARAGLRALEATRAWRLVSFYWAWVRRLRGERPESLGK